MHQRLDDIGKTIGTGFKQHALGRFGPVVQLQMFVAVRDVVGRVLSFRIELTVQNLHREVGRGWDTVHSKDDHNFFRASGAFSFLFLVVFVHGQVTHGKDDAVGDVSLFD